MHLFFLQVTDTNALAAEAGSKSLSIIELCMKGGIIMIPITLLSIISVYIFIERYFAIRKATKNSPDFMRNIRDYMTGGNVGAAEALCRSENSPMSRMVDKGLKRLGKPLDTISTAIENVGNLELLQLEKGLNVLATIAGIAPMLGFLGTVTGMIRAFFDIANSENNVTPGLLASGIYEALVTTVAGLVVGIIAFMFYNYLVNLVSKVVYKMEATSVEFIDLLQEPVK